MLTLTITILLRLNQNVNRMTDKRVVIVGASSGIGREVARQFLKAGCRVGVASRREERLKELSDEFPGQVEYQQIDVMSADCVPLLDRLIEKLGGMDVYFHAAGVGSQNTDVDPEIENRTVQTNVVGFTLMIDHVFNYFAIRGGGQIGAISSIAGTRGLGPAPSYSATKSFQNKYLEALTQLSHNRRLGIAVTDIRPGFVDTALLDGDFRYPMKMKADKVARAIFLALKRKQAVVTIDWRYRLLVFFWRLVPAPLWRRIRLVK